MWMERSGKNTSTYQQGYEQLFNRKKGLNVDK